ncbi:homoserine/homoserine lactone efflux protein [Yersinia frederiksenii]|nr:homoserine/homoserine lactone efflux protein [Yersinia frederiksenii]CNC88674.1 homoserine/homoserine lactone efflux protein [Yersinia frederiksenii]CNH20149.1 homoserine/homoserine lactone efflux protein [Yersinia frederiksenii]CNH92942.1 homoserine/homoserine lactone efflux protein [Yersinia frederiksenii]CNK96624.1 homoserine/homoserine lactone efflux protein [Yersinia frederiksenii]
MQMSSEFLITSLIVVISPGTGALYTIATGLGSGVKQSLIAAVGCTLGIIPHMLAAITGLAAIFHTSAAAFGIIKFLGVIWLLYMAWITLKQNGPLQIESTNETATPLKVIVHAVLINLLNPKLSLFFLAFLPQFISTETASPTNDMLILSGIFMLMTLLIFMLYGVFSSFMRGHILSRPKVMKILRASFSLSFIGLGIKLILTQRE